MDDKCPPRSKLHLKRTPAEKAERARRKAHKAARKAAKKYKTSATDGYTSTDSRRSRDTRKTQKRWRSGDDDYSHYPSPSPSARPLDSDAIHAQMEEEAFMEKMQGALDDDERLDAIDSKFRSYAHIPDRWRNTRTGREDHLARDPQYMDDDEYAEWIREGMWRKKHAREYEEQVQKETERAARRAQEAEIRAETARLEKASRESQEQLKREKTKLREQEYRQRYEVRWKELLNPNAKDAKQLAFLDIPWPLYPVSSANHAHKLEDFTEEAISTFLIPPPVSSDPSSVGVDEPVRKEKEKLKEAMLRFHPDKFEGRIMHRVLDADRDQVKEAAGQVVRVLNTLMSSRSL
ncbi:hypothetical protein V8B97DRAFT_2023865 [Scleroderma yunnanense]